MINNANKKSGKSRWASHWKLYAVFAVCAAPMIASYLTYYFLKPQGRTNYGALLDPRAYPMPPLGLDAYKGKWILLYAHPSACDARCRTQLHDLRQLRLAQGKDSDRIERVWLVTDEQKVPAELERDYPDMRIVRAPASAVDAWLPVEAGNRAADHIYMIDPLSNLMMRFPKNADANKIKRDISKLLRASRVG